MENLLRKAKRSKRNPSAAARLVQLCTQDWLELQKTKETYQEEAVRLFSGNFPIGEYGNWKICEALLLHRATPSHDVSQYELRQGRYETAYRSSTEAYKILESFLENNPRVLESLERLAIVAWCRSMHMEAEKMARRVLNAREKVLVGEHPGTLTSVHCLGWVLRGQSKNGEAEEMVRQALNGREKALGKEHHDTLLSALCLAIVLGCCGKHGEAGR
ncbi:hypothetical protein FGG08_000547 [Glutinoglossum americanum]|uniref:Uncharacterized protein n=1 Tax=Glutinoglossum americanum TaxID=1670608 RepID=A0A9P8IF92_9PEZI|nr:hypothetical protein FGG08_000547 [Glutinoglossum americanum]